MKKTIVTSVIACVSLFTVNSKSFAAGLSANPSDILLLGSGPTVPVAYDIPMPGKGKGVPMAYDIPMPGKGKGVPMAYDIPMPGKGKGVPMAHLR